MNNYLLDTHVLLWWLQDPTKLSTAAREAITNPSHAIFVSAAAAWEIGIKQALGRLEIPNDLPNILEQNNFTTLPISLNHGLAVAQLPLHHQDPFDRMMITQALQEKLILITRDDKIQKYDVPQILA